MKAVFETPVLFLIFNRVNTTWQVFNEIKKQRPRYLFIASDGPRPGVAGEKQVVEDLRKQILDEIDWECEVETLFRENNLGCGKGVSGAITWFFKNVEQGIILEDDCLPLPGFFSFCEENLNYYKDNNHIYEVSGSNLQAGKIIGDASYYFSNYGSIWGWASWARAWENYKFDLSGQDETAQREIIKKIFSDRHQRQYWIDKLNKARDIDTWDYQWLYTHWKSGGLCIVPNINLIKNIGFNAEATHTTSEPNWYKKAISGNHRFGKITHAKNIEVNIKADDFLYDKYYKPAPLYIRGIARIKKLLRAK